MSPAHSPISRIAFLCGCAEPGRDGVGDYTAMLAAECERRGLRTLRVALNDRYVTASREGDGLLRLPAGAEWERAREAVERFGAEAVSLQWVPYAFHPRGVPWGIGNALEEIVAGRAVQVMCHEIWIGAEVGAGLGHRLTGAAQRRVLRSLVRKLKPVCVHTSNAAYAGLLAGVGIDAEVLPLFGAIPITGHAAKGEGVRFGMFGELHPEWPPEPLLERLCRLEMPVGVEHIGRIGRGDGVWEAITRREGIAFKRYGEQPVERVSQFLAEVDFGIATTPLALLGKSGTAAAMLEHGLPVIVNRDDVRYAGIDPGPAPDGVIVMGDGFLDALRVAKRREARSRLPEVADQFLQSLRRGVP